MVFLRHIQGFFPVNAEILKLSMNQADFSIIKTKSLLCRKVFQSTKLIKNQSLLIHAGVTERLQLLLQLMGVDGIVNLLLRLVIQNSAAKLKKVFRDVLCKPTESSFLSVDTEVLFPLVEYSVGLK